MLRYVVVRWCNSDVEVVTCINTTTSQHNNTTITPQHITTTYLNTSTLQHYNTTYNTTNLNISTPQHLNTTT
ncbi:MAG: hypothetical protein SPD86_07795 [Prevotella sp.]|nr:hypothetical protein [Prevotella sp.]